MVWVGRDLKEHLVKTPHLPLDQVTQSPIQPGLGTLPGKGQPQLLWATCASASPPSE